MKAYKIFFFILIAAGFSLNLFSQTSGGNDSTFNTLDAGNGIGDAADNEIHAVAVQPDGKILLGGNFTKFNGASALRIIRLNTDGTIDNTFSIGTGANATVRSIAIQADGKIIIGGDFTSYNGVSKNRIVRLDPNGVIDAGFLSGVAANNSVNSIYIQPDGKILIGGAFTTYNGSSANRITRLTTNGQVDVAFTTGTGLNGAVNSIILQADNKIIIGGSFGLYNGSVTNNIVRLDTLGIFDAAFVSSAVGAIKTLAIQPDGKILAGGSFTAYNSVTTNRIVRLNSNGSIDGTFIAGANNNVNSITLQSDGKILVGGSFTTFNGTIVKNFIRVDSNGSIDATFLSGPLAGANDYQNAAAIQPDGKIITVGFFTQYNGVFKNYITRLNLNGTNDAAFNIGTSADNVINTTVFQNDGKILIGGGFTSYNNKERKGVARLNSDGTLDTTFITGAGTNAAVQAIVVQTDGKIIVGGNFSTFDNTTANRLIRLNQNGSLDVGFNVGIGPNMMVIALAIQSDGKILVGGNFNYFNGILKNVIVRLNTDGSLDPTFDAGTYFTSTEVRTIVIQPDGKILVGGNFGGFNGVQSIDIARLNINGSVDPTFITGAGFSGSVNSVSRQADGKIIVGGTYNYYNSISANRICRLNTNGTIDATFNTGTGTNHNVTATAVQPDGKILIAGPFTSYMGTTAKSICRLNANGSLDPTFSSGAGASNTNVINHINLQNDGKVLIAGYFTNYSSIGRNRISRLNNFCATPIISNITPAQNLSICANKNTTLSVSGLGVINWYSSQTSTTSIATGTTFTTPILSSGTYTFFADAYVCSSSPREAIVVNVNSFSSPTITLNNGSICSGESFTLNPAGATTYTYSSGSQIVSPNSTTSYSVIGTDSNGCISNTVSNTVTVNPLPIVTVNSGGICSGNSFTIIPSGATSYSYSGGSDVVSPTSNTNYSITGTDMNGCVSNTAVSSVTVNSLPILTVNSGSICVGNSFTMSPIGANTYTFSNGNSVVSPTSNTSYSITGTDINGCISNIAVSSVTVSNLPLVMATTNNTLLCTGETATLTASGAASYTWSTNETTNSIVINPTASTNYTLNGVDVNGCSNTYTISQLVDLCTGIVEAVVFEKLKIYPNPTDGLFSIDLPNISEVSMTNVLGENILNEKFVLGKQVINIQNQPAGIYYVKVISNKNQQTVKLIKE